MIPPVCSSHQGNSQTSGTSKVHSVLKLSSSNTAPWCQIHGFQSSAGSLKEGAGLLQPTERERDGGAESVPLPFEGG